MKKRTPTSPNPIKAPPTKPQSSFPRPRNLDSDYIPEWNPPKLSPAPDKDEDCIPELNPPRPVPVGEISSKAPKVEWLGVEDTMDEDDDDGVWEE